MLGRRSFGPGSIWTPRKIEISETLRGSEPGLSLNVKMSLLRVDQGVKLHRKYRRQLS
jgi:hypothetical protein